MDDTSPSDPQDPRPPAHLPGSGEIAADIIHHDHDPLTSDISDNT